MSLKFRLAFLFSLSVFIILLISAVSIFLFNESFRKGEFNKRLLLEGTETVDLFFNVGSSSAVLEDIDQLIDNSSHDTKVFIFDSAYALLYSPHRLPAPSIGKNLFV